MVYIHLLKAICHSYQAYAQMSVCMFTVAMETSTNKVKKLFFILFYIFLLFPKLLIKVSVAHHIICCKLVLCWSLGGAVFK